MSDGGTKPTVAVNAAREAWQLRQRMLTNEIRQIPLKDVMERVFGLAGEKSGVKAIKYRLDDGTLLQIQTEGHLFGALEHRKFSCLHNKGGSANAIDLAMAVKEANGQSCTFWEARELLQRTFLPHTIESESLQSATKKIEVGAVDLAAFYHKGAVLQGPKGYDLVLSSWKEDEKQTGAVAVVACDEEGRALPGAAERKHSIRPTTYAYEGKEPEGVITIAKSAHGLIPDGTTSADAALLLVPHGPFRGLMLGQLNETQLADLRRESRSEMLRRAVDETKPLLFAFVAKHREERPPSEVKPVAIPDRLDFIKIDGRLLDNHKIARNYLTETRQLDPVLVDQALAAKGVIPAESKIPVKDRVTGKEIPGKFYHHPALCIPILAFPSMAPIAYQLKILYQDPDMAARFKGHDSYNCGPIQSGVSLIGEWSDKTLEAVVTEAYIDGLSYKQLRNLPATTCILVTHGARVPLELIEECARRDIKLISALDNDHTGRRVAAQIAEECERRGVRYGNDTPEPSEIRLALRENDIGRARYAETRNFCAENGVMFEEQKEERGWLRIVLDNTPTSAQYVDELKLADSKARAREGREQKFVATRFDNKDWNDLAKGEYRRTFSKAKERMFRAQTVGPHEAPLVPAVAAERKAIGDYLNEAAAGVSFTAEAQNIFLGLAAEALRKGGRTIDTLTLGEMKTLAGEAANIYADRLEERMLLDGPSLAKFDVLAVVADLRSFRQKLERAKTGDRPALQQEAERVADSIPGPGLTGVPLRVTAKNYLQGKEPLEKLTQRALDHAYAIGQRLSHGLELGERGHAHGL